MSCWEAYTDRPSSEAASLEADAALFGRNRGREFMSGAKGKKHQGAGVQDCVSLVKPYFGDFDVMRAEQHKIS